MTMRTKLLLTGTLSLLLLGFSFGPVLNSLAAYVGPIKQNVKVVKQVTAGASYNSDWINLVNDSRVSGGVKEEVGHEAGGGYEGAWVRYVNNSTDSIKVDLNLEPGTYEFAYVARYGVYNAHDPHETNEDLSFVFGNETVRVTDPEQDNFLFKVWESVDTNTTQEFTITEAIDHFNIRGTGARIEFGQLKLSGEVTPEEPEEPDQPDNPEQNDPPTCTLRAEPNSGSAPLTVQHFYITTNDPNHDQITSFSFNLGDSNTWYGPYAKDPAGDYGSYTYVNAGRYEPKIKIWDEHGAEGSCNTTVNVDQATPSNYKLTIEKTSSPSDTHFYWNNGTEKGKVFTYTIHYKNESSVALNKVYLFDEFYRTQGNLQDALLDNLKCSAVPNGPANSPCKIIDIPRPGQEAFQTIYWDLGTLTPGQSGTVYLRGEVKDLAPNWVEGYLLQNDVYLRDNWEGIESKPNTTADDHVDQWLHINGIPTCELGVTPASVTLGQSVKVSYNATDDHKVATYDADLGDGNRVNGTPWTGPVSFEYTYKRAGQYNLTLRVYDDNHAASELCQAQVEVKKPLAPPIVVQNTPPDCDIEANPNSGTAPLALQFMMRARDGQDETMKNWSLSTGQDTFNGLGDPPQFKDYTYQKKGTYTARLQVTDHNNSSYTCQTEIKVQAPPVVVQGNTNLSIRKLVSASNLGNFEDANTSASALDLGKVTTETVTLTYKVELSNSGNADATNVVIADIFTRGARGTNRSDINNVTGATYQNGNFTVAKVAANKTASFTYQSKLSVPNAATTEIKDTAYNTVRISSFQSSGKQSGVGANDPAYLTLTIPALAPPGKAEFTIDKQVEKDRMTVSEAEDEENLQYTITVKNTGTAEGEVRVTDTMTRNEVRGNRGGTFSYNDDLKVSGAVSFSGDLNENNGVTLKIAAGAEVKLTYTVEMEDLDEITSDETSEFHNTAKLSSGPSAAEVVKIDGEELEFEIEKTVKAPTLLKSGDVVTYTLKIRNTGDATGTVNVTDTIAAKKTSGTYYLPGKNGGRLEYLSGSMDVDGISESRIDGEITDRDGIELEDFEEGDKVTITYQAIAVIDGIAVGKQSLVENEACVEFNDDEDCDKAEITLGSETPSGNFSVAKTVSPSSFTANGSATYTITVDNNSSEPKSVKVTDTIGNQGYLVGDQGGRLTYQSGSMTVTGATSVEGNIGTPQGVYLLLNANASATIRYNVTVDLSTVGAGHSSQVSNLVLLSTGESSRATVSLTRSSGTYIPPRTHYVTPPTTFTKTGGAMLPAGLATALGGLLSYFIRRKRLGL